MNQAQKTPRSDGDSAATQWLTIKQSCPVAQVGPKVLYREIAAGRLRAARIGGRRDLRIHRRWIDEWLEQAAEPVERGRR